MLRNLIKICSRLNRISVESQLINFMIQGDKRSREERKVQGFIEEELLPYAGSPKYFISYTQIPKIGLNPSSTFNTPIGIYTYPLKDIYDHVLNNSIPFADDIKTPYLWLLEMKNPNTFINDLQTSYKKADLDRDIKKLKKYFRNDPRAIEFIELYSERVGEIRLKKELQKKGYPELLIEKLPVTNLVPGKLLWNMTNNLAKFFMKGKPPVQWNVLFRKVLGYSGIADRSNKGYIHGGEKTQAVFFSKDAFKVVKLLDKKKYNKYRDKGDSNNSRDLRVLKGENEITPEELMEKSDAFKIQFIMEEKNLKLKLPEDFWTVNIMTGVLYYNPEKAFINNRFPFNRVKEIPSKSLKAIVNRNLKGMVPVFKQSGDRRILGYIREQILATPFEYLRELGELENEFKDDVVLVQSILKELRESLGTSMISYIPDFILKEVAEDNYYKELSGEEILGLNTNIRNIVIELPGIRDKVKNVLIKNPDRVFLIGPKTLAEILDADLVKAFIKNNSLPELYDQAQLDNKVIKVLGDYYSNPKGGTELHRLSAILNQPTNIIGQLLRHPGVMNFLSKSITSYPLHFIRYPFSFLSKIKGFNEFKKLALEKMLDPINPLRHFSKDLKEALNDNQELIKDFFIEHGLSNPDYIIKRENLEKLYEDQEFIKQILSSKQAAIALELPLENIDAALDDPKVIDNIKSKLPNINLRYVDDNVIESLVKKPEIKEELKTILIKDWRSIDKFPTDLIEEFESDKELIIKSLETDPKSLASMRPNVLEKVLHTPTLLKTLRTYRLSAIPKESFLVLREDPIILNEIFNNIKENLYLSYALPIEIIEPIINNVNWKPYFRDMVSDDIDNIEGMNVNFLKELLEDPGFKSIIGPDVYKDVSTQIKAGITNIILSTNDFDD